MSSPMETDVDPLALRTYIQQYSGLTRYTRLLTLADKQKALRLEAIQLCLEMAKQEKKIL